MAKVDLPDYGYVNARVRGMRAYLLTRDFFMNLVKAEDTDTIHSLLEQTVYRREIDEAILIRPERPDYDYALNVNLVATLRKIIDATGGEVERLVGLLYTRYDIHNVKTILRGKKGSATSSEIITAMIPIGNIRIEVLEELSKCREILDVVSLMGEYRIKYKKTLEEAYEEFKEREEDLSVLELALDKFHYTDCLEQLKGKGSNIALTRRMFINELDMRNISTLVRIRGIKLDDDEVKNFCITGGALEPEKFLELHRSGDVAKIVSEYPDPEYRKVLDRALAAYEEVDIAAFDRELEHGLTTLGAGMSNIDVLGIGVIIGYMWLKQNEIVNLRVILKGKAIGRPETEISNDLFFVEREELQVA
ncbi:MAG: V-type ATPase subunit [Actinomycetota bacterium]|nr:V-type ATPase subunit [Actinomycetota bacterium]